MAARYLFVFCRLNLQRLQKQIHRLKNSSHLKKNSWKTAIDSWKDRSLVIREHPILGIGQAQEPFGMQHTSGTGQKMKIYRIPAKTFISSLKKI